MKITEKEKIDIIATANAMADAARGAVLPFFRNFGIATENKDAAGGFDPVTAADRASERAMREILADRRPQDAILGEEYGHVHGTSGLTWVLDPIDGTRAFISGAPVWGVLIAVGDETGPKFGIVDQPYIDERFVGGFGETSLTRAGQKSPLGVRRSIAVDDAILMSTFPEIGTDAERAAFGRVASQVKLTRYGLDCYAYALLAAGQIDLVIEAGLHAYDIQAPIAVIEAAGGVVTDWDGQPVHNGGNVLAAGDRTLHRAAMELLNSG